MRLFHDLPVVAHLSYLPNLAKIDEDPRHLKAVFHEAALCKQLGIDRLIMHCGSRKQRKRGMANVAEGVDRVLAAFDISVMLENAAGQGDSLRHAAAIPRAKLPDIEDAVQRAGVLRHYQLLGRQLRDRVGQDVFDLLDEDEFHVLSYVLGYVDKVLLIGLGNHHAANAGPACGERRPRRLPPLRVAGDSPRDVSVRPPPP